ncbi:MAG: PAS domain S-box protein [Bacteroidota bacterium]
MDDNTYKQKPLLVSIVVFLALLALAQYLTYQRYLIKLHNDEKRAENAMNAVRDRFQTSLNYSLAASKTLSYIVQQYGVPNNFDSVAKTLIESNKCIDAIELVQGGTITHVYPLAGNEVVLGYNILKDSTRSKEAFIAIEKRELFFAGPLQLKQGGMAIVGRLPIFIKDTFFGFSVVLLKLPTVVKALGIDEAYNKEFIFQLSKIDPETGKENFFLEGDRDFEEGHFVSVTVPNGDWILRVKGRNGTSFGSLIVMMFLGLMLAITGGVFTWFIARQPILLSKKVDEQTELLSESEKRYHDLFELSPLPAWVFDLENLKILDVNKAAVDEYGYTRNEFLNMQMSDLLVDRPVREDDVNVVSNNFKGSKILLHKKKSGKIIQVEIQENTIPYNGKTVDLIIANNITERQNYIAAIEDQNTRIREIAWIQSHVVRAPLARIMGLVDLIKNSEKGEENEAELMNRIIESANELDGIIADISNKASKIDLEFDAQQGGT